MANKMTNSMALAYVLENCTLTDEVREKITNIKASIDKKNAKTTPTKTQTENIGIKDLILEVLTDGKPKTITEIQAANTELYALSNQKVSALVRQLVNDEVVIKTVDKKKSYFSLAE